MWGMALLDQENRLLTGSADSELRAWDISYLEEVRMNAAWGARGHKEYIRSRNFGYFLRTDPFSS